MRDIDNTRKYNSYGISKRPYKVLFIILISIDEMNKTQAAKIDQNTFQTIISIIINMHKNGRYLMKEEKIYKNKFSKQ